jgi:O-glycosyl hydrolase
MPSFREGCHPLKKDAILFFLFSLFALSGTLSAATTPSAASTTPPAATTVTVDAAVTYQTMLGFGASDAWNIDYVGRYWSSAQKEAIAEKLFSTAFTTTGNPKGIGLSRWRFNIGAGSAEQGSASNIEQAERRVECFLNADGSYNWTKQAGQQWFLQKAKSYGVDQLVAFVNSPPRFYTKNGRANSDNTSTDQGTNLKYDGYDDYATFLATVLAHFKAKGLPFAHISPVNEPQFKWEKGQEGCPWNNTEIKALVAALNQALTDSALDTRILVAEASGYKDLHQSVSPTNKTDQIWKFFNTSRPEYLGSFDHMLPGICGHSYWTDGDDNTIRAERENVYRECQEQGGIAFYQTEYNLLSRSFSTAWENSLFLAKMIHADLAIAHAALWDYWTAVERERWSQLNRFYLMRLRPNGGDYADLTAGGTFSVDKNLWILGQYSRFIRPGYTQVKTTGADDLNGLMGSAYLSPNTDTLVLVYVNYATQDQVIAQQLLNLPGGRTVSSIQPYLTSTSYNLSPRPQVTPGTDITLPARSVTTLVLTLTQPSAVATAPAPAPWTVYPNPTSNGLFHLSWPSVTAQTTGTTALLTVTDLQGRRVKHYDTAQGLPSTIDLSDQPAGWYHLAFQDQVLKLLKR